MPIKLDDPNDLRPTYPKLPPLSQTLGAQAEPDQPRYKSDPGRVARANALAAAPSQEQGSTLGNIGRGLAVGGMQLAQSLGNLPSLATGGAIPRAFDFDDEMQAMRAGYTPEVQEQQRNIQEAEGFFGTLGAAVQNPRGAGQYLVESAPSFLPGLGAGALGARVGGQVAARGLAGQVAQQAAQQGAQRGAMAGLVSSNAALSAGFSGDEAYQTVLQMPEETLRLYPEYQRLAEQGLPPEDIREQLANMAGQGALFPGAALGAATSFIGAPIEARLLSGQAATAGGALRNIGVTAGSQFAEEAAQEGAEQLSTNIGVRRVDPTQPLGENVPEAAAIGGILGAGAGVTLAGAGEVVRRRGGDEAQLPESAEEPVPQAPEQPRTLASPQRLLTVDRDKGLGDRARETLDVVRSVLLERPNVDPNMRTLLENYGDTQREGRIPSTLGKGQEPGRPVQVEGPSTEPTETGRVLQEQEKTGLEADRPDFSGVIERILGNTERPGDTWGLVSGGEQPLGGVNVPSRSGRSATVVPLNDSGLFEATPDGIGAATEFVRDLAGAQTGAEQIFDQASGYGQRLVMSAVRTALHDPEVRRGVVEAVPVNVMNNLIGQELSAQDVLSNPNVLLDSLAVDADQAIAAPIIRVVDELLSFVPRGSAGVGASSGAEITSPDMGRGAADTVSAATTDDIDRHTGEHTGKRQQAQREPKDIPATEPSEPITTTEAADEKTQQAETAPVLSGQPDVLTKAGKPFGSRKRAEFAAKSKGMTETHEPVETFPGQWVLRARGSADARPVPPSEGQGTPPKAKRITNAPVDTKADTIVTAIAKLGGLDRTEAEAQGIDPSMARDRRINATVFGNPVFRASKGRSFDDLAESLSELGYFTPEELQSPNLGAILLDKISQELNEGRPVRTPAGTEAAMNREMGGADPFENLEETDFLDLGFDQDSPIEQQIVEAQAKIRAGTDEDTADRIIETLAARYPDDADFLAGLEAVLGRPGQGVPTGQGTRPPGEREALELTPESEEDTKTREAEQKRRAAEQAKKDKAAEQKAKADRAAKEPLVLGDQQTDLVAQVNSERFAEEAEQRAKAAPAAEGEAGGEDRRAQFPKLSKFTEWALGKAKSTTEVVEYDGKRYTKTDRVWRGNLGGRAGELRQEIGKANRIGLINQDRHQLTVQVDGKNMDDRGTVRVHETTWTPIKDAEAPAKKAVEPSRLSPEEAKKRIKWVNMGTEGGVTTHHARFTDEDGQHITVASVSRSGPKSPWRVDDTEADIEPDHSLAKVKKAAVDQEAIPRLIDQGYVAPDTRYSRAQPARSTVPAIREALGLTTAQERRIGLSIEQSPGEGVPADVAGMYRNGDIVLFADNLSVDEVRATLLHEVTHKATREAMATPAFQQILAAVDRLRGRQGVFAEADRRLRRSEPELTRNFEANPNGRETQMVNGREVPALLTYRERYLDEVLAYVAQTEKGRKSAPFRRLVALIRDYLRRMGLVRRYSENDLLQIAPIALRRLARGETMVRSYNGMAEPVYHRVFHGTSLGADVAEPNAGTSQVVRDKLLTDAQRKRRIGKRQAFVRALNDILNVGTAFGVRVKGTNLTDGDSTPIKNVDQSVVRNFELLGNVIASETFLKHGYGGLDTKTRSLVEAAVVDVVDNLKIGDSVIEFVPIDVVNILGGEKGAAKMSLHDVTMLHDRLAVDSEPPVATMDGASSLMERVALLGAEKLARSGFSDRVALPVDGLATSETIKGRQSDSALELANSILTELQTISQTTDPLLKRNEEALDAIQDAQGDAAYSRPADATDRAALGRSLLARNRGDLAAAQREARALYPGMAEDINDWVEQNRDRWQESGGDVRYSRASTTIPTGQNAALDAARAKIGASRKGIADRIRDIQAGGWDGLRNMRKRLAENLTQGMFDKFHGIKLAEDRVRGTLPHEQSGYVGARLSTGLSSVMQAVLLNGHPEWNNGVIARKADTQGLLDTLSPVKDRMDDFLHWMIGERAYRLKQEGRENLFSDDDIKALRDLNKGNEKLFRDTRDRFVEFKRSVLDLAEESGLIDATTRPLWDNADWIPFYRIREGEPAGPKGRAGLSGQTSGIRQLRGGESNIGDPLENILMNFSHLIDASMKNMALRKTVDNLAGSDLLSDVTTQERFKPAIIPLSQMKKVLTDAGMDPNALPKNALNGMRRLWSYTPPADPNVVRVMVNGKAKYYHVEDPLLLRALTGINATPMGGIVKPLRFFKRLLTGAVTADPAFMARNFIRDALHAWTINDDHFHPGIASVKGAVRSMQKKGGFEDMLFAGASFMGGYVNASDPGELNRAIRRSLRAKGMSAASTDEFMATIIDTPAKWWEKYREIGDALENANREAVYEAARREGKSLAQAAYEAKDLMDYSMRGDFAVMQFMSDVIPFLSARMQGLYKLWRSGAVPLSPKMQRLHVMKGLVITSAALALLALNRDDERWDDLEEWDKNSYWHIFIGNQHFRIPKPFEIGVIYGTVPERIMMNLLGDDDTAKTAEQALWTIKETFAVSPVPQAFQPWLDVYANRDAFTGRPIENMADEGKIVSARYGATTSPTMIGIGKGISDLTGLSPKELEHLWQGYMGQMGVYALTLADVATRAVMGMPEMPEWRIDDYPVVKSFARASPARSTRFRTEFYEMYREAEELYRTVNWLRRQGQGEEAQRLIAENRDTLRSRRMLMITQRSLSEVRRRIEAVYNNPRMSPERKRVQIDALVTLQNTMAKRAVQAAG